MDLPGLLVHQEVFLTIIIMGCENAEIFIVHQKYFWQSDYNKLKFSWQSYFADSWWSYLHQYLCVWPIIIIIPIVGHQNNSTQSQKFCPPSSWPPQSQRSLGLPVATGKTERRKFQHSWFYSTKTHMLWMTHLGLCNFFNQSWYLDILGNGELAGNGSIIRLGGSVNDDFLRGWHVRRYQDTRINLRRIFDLKLVSIFCWQNISLYNEK